MRHPENPNVSSKPGLTVPKREDFFLHSASSRDTHTESMDAAAALQRVGHDEPEGSGSPIVETPSKFDLKPASFLKMRSQELTPNEGGSDALSADQLKGVEG